MNIDRFRALTSAWGAHSDRWPEGERQSALTLLEQSQEARTILAAAQEMDAMLDGYTLPAATADNLRLKQNITASINRPITQTSALTSLMNWLMPRGSKSLFFLWRPAVVASIPLMLGIAVGLTLFDNTTDTLTTDEELMLLALSEPGIEVWTYE